MSRNGVNFAGQSFFKILSEKRGEGKEKEQFFVQKMNLIDGSLLLFEVNYH